MALPATMYRATLEISDVDRGVYETAELRVAQHPSESDEYLVTRLLAYALEWEPDIAFGRGVSTPDEPTLAVTDPTGTIQRWIEVGAPSADRLHKITKRADDVAVYSHKDVPLLLEGWRAASIHRAEQVRVYDIDRDFVARLAGKLERALSWDVLRTDGAIYVTIGGDAHFTTLREQRIGPPDGGA